MDSAQQQYNNTFIILRGFEDLLIQEMPFVTEMKDFIDLSKGAGEAKQHFDAAMKKATNEIQQAYQSNRILLNGIRLQLVEIEKNNEKIYRMTGKPREYVYDTEEVEGTLNITNMLEHCGRWDEHGKEREEQEGFPELIPLTASSGAIAPISKATRERIYMRIVPEAPQ